MDFFYLSPSLFLTGDQKKLQLASVLSAKDAGEEAAYSWLGSIALQHLELLGPLCPQRHGVRVLADARGTPRTMTARRTPAAAASKSERRAAENMRAVRTGAIDAVTVAGRLLHRPRRGALTSTRIKVDRTAGSFGSVVSDPSMQHPINF